MQLRVTTSATTFDKDMGFLPGVNLNYPGGKFTELQTSIFSVKKVIVLHEIAVAPYIFVAQKRGQPRKCNSKPTKTAEKPQNLQKVVGLRPEDFFFEITTRLPEI